MARVSRGDSYMAHCFRGSLEASQNDTRIFTPSAKLRDARAGASIFRCYDLIGRCFGSLSQRFLVSLRYRECIGPTSVRHGIKWQLSMRLPLDSCLRMICPAQSPVRHRAALECASTHRHARLPPICSCRSHSRQSVVPLLEAAPALPLRCLYRHR